jgi:hypothetical protein
MKVSTEQRAEHTEIPQVCKSLQRCVKLGQPRKAQLRAKKFHYLSTLQ